MDNFLNIHVYQYIILCLLWCRDLETKIEWDVKAPFTIEPSAAILKSGAARQFKATFTPIVRKIHLS